VFPLDLKKLQEGKNKVKLLEKVSGARSEIKERSYS